MAFCCSSLSDSSALKGGSSCYRPCCPVKAFCGQSCKDKKLMCTFIAKLPCSTITDFLPAVRKPLNLGTSASLARVPPLLGPCHHLSHLLLSWWCELEEISRIISSKILVECRNDTLKSSLSTTYPAFSWNPPMKVILQLPWSVYSTTSLYLTVKMFSLIAILNRLLWFKVIALCLALWGKK